MRRIETILAGITAGSIALTTFGGIEMNKNSGAGKNQDDWTNQQAILTSDIINNLPQNFSQATQADQEKIDNLRKQLSTITQELAANKGSTDAEHLGDVALGAGAVLTIMTGSATVKKISDRKRMDKFIRDTRLDGIPPHARWGGY